MIAVLTVMMMLILEGVAAVAEAAGAVAGVVCTVAKSAASA
jgi:hypothetical protein